MADDQLKDQDAIERLLGAGQDEAPSASPQQPAAADAPAQGLDQGEVESLLNGGTIAAGNAEQPQTAAATSGPATPTAEPAQAPQAPEEGNQPLGQEGVEKLLQQAGTAPPKPGSQPAAPKPAGADPLVGEGEMLPGDADYLLKQAEQALESINVAAAGDLPQGVSAFRLQEFSGAPASTENATFDLIRDVELDLKIELGRTHMYLEDVLKLRKGSVVPLDKLAGDPVDVYVNGRLIARGEVLVLSDNFCVRIAELIAGINTPA